MIKWFTYAPPIIIVLATVGNTLSVITLQNAMFHKSSTSFILSALALADMLMVDTGLLRFWIVFQFDIDVRAMTSLGCKWHVMFTYYTHQVSQIVHVL